MGIQLPESEKLNIEDLQRMGEFDIVDAYEDQKKNNRGILKPICKLKFRMHTAVREDILRYLQSGNTMEEKVI